VYNLEYTDKKEKKIFLINKEIQNGSVAKSYRRKGFLIYEFIDESRMNILIYEKNLMFFFISVQRIEIDGIHKQKSAF
jgi:hypothetical protein